MLKPIALLVLCSCLSFGQEDRPHRNWRTVLYRTSAIALAAATAADAGSSWGGREANSLLRSGDGRFGARGAAIKFGLLGGILVTQHLCRKKYANTELPFTVFNTAMTAVSTKIALENIGIRRRAAQ